MALTVEGLLARMQHKGMCCVAGFNGLSNPITSFSIVDTPDITQWLKGGEFVTSTGYVVGENPYLQKILVRELAEKGCAGLGVKKNHFHKTMPKEFIEQGNLYNFPIIELDYDLRFSDISFHVHQSNFQDEMSVTDKINMIYRKIVKIMFSTDDLEDVLFHICTVIPDPVVLLDRDFRTIAYENPAANQVDLSQFLVLEKNRFALSEKTIKSVSRVYAETHFRSHPIPFLYGERMLEFVLIPIEVGNIHWGFMLIPQTIQPLSNEHCEILQGLQSAVGMYFLKHGLAPAAIGKNKDSFLSQVLLNDNNTRANIRYYANMYHFDYQKRRVCVNLHIHRYHDFSYAKRKSLAEFIHRTFHSLADLHGLGYFQVDSGDDFAVFYFFPQGDASKNAKFTTRSMVLELDHKLQNYGAEAKIGVSDLSLDISQIPISFKQAVDVINLGFRIDLDTTVFFYDEWQTYYMLDSTMDEEELRALANTVWDLYQEDKENNTCYIETLEVFIKHKFNLSKAAADIHLHRNSLVYRLNKIRDILSIDLDEQYNLFKIQLSLQALRLYTSRTTQES